MSGDSHQPTLGVTLVRSNGFFKPTSCVYMLHCNMVGWMSIKGALRKHALSCLYVFWMKRMHSLRCKRLGFGHVVKSPATLKSIVFTEDLNVRSLPGVSVGTITYIVLCTVRPQLQQPCMYVKRSIIIPICIGEAETSYAN